jgi:hypothetical protein
MDELEEYIQNNRKQIDIHDPDPGVWKKIEKELPRNEIRLPVFIWRAAVILIIVAAGTTVILKTISTTRKLNDPRMTAVQETYLYYNSQIRSLYEEAKPLLTANPDISNELEAGMSQLDSLSLQIRKDLGDNVASEEVIGALINNYRLRIELLEDMLILMKEKEAETTNKPDHEL